MAELGSTTIYGHEKVTGNLTVKGMVTIGTPAVNSCLNVYGPILQCGLPYGGIGCITSDCQNLIGCSTIPNACSCFSVNLGTQAGNGACCSQLFVAIGYQAGLNSCGSCNSVFIGPFSGACSCLGTYSVILGYRSGFCSSCNSYSVNLGYYSGACNNNSCSSVFVGSSSGLYATNSSYSIMIGTASGYCACCSSYNIFLGQCSGYNSCCMTCSIFIGACSGYGICCSCNLLMLGNNVGTTPLLCGKMNGTPAGQCLTINGAVQSIGSMRIDDSNGNAGFRLSFNCVSSTLDFVYIGS